MKDSHKQWQRTERSVPSPDAQYAAPLIKTLERLITEKDSHIESLKQQVADQKHLIQVLSDDKYFKPALIDKPLPPVENVSAFEAKDYEYSTPQDEIKEEDDVEHDQTLLLTELEALAEEQAEYKENPRAYARR